MAVLIASSLGTSMSAATGRGYQRHLVYATNSGKWLAFFLTSTNSLSCYYSSDFSTWTQASGSPYTLPNTAHGSEGRDFSVAYKSISSTDVLHIAYRNNSDSACYDIRGTFSGTTWTQSSAAQVDLYAGAITVPPSLDICLDSNNRPVMLTCMLSGGDPSTYRATNTDSGSSWTSGWGSGTDVWGSGLDHMHGGCIYDSGSGNVLTLFSDGQGSGTTEMKNVKWSQYNGSSWSSAASVFSSSLSSGVNAADFGAVARTTSDVHCVIRASSSNTNTYTHRIFNGSSWSNGGSITNQTYKASAGNFTMATDGTTVWLFVLNTDTPNTIQYCSYAGGSWSGWSSLEGSGTQTRSCLTCWPIVVSNTIGLLYTQTNGSNYDLYGTLLSLSSGSSDSPRVMYAGDYGLGLPIATQPFCPIPYTD